MVKTIGSQQTIGSIGEKRVDTRATEIGFLYHPTGRTEAGIDGYMEIRDPETGAVQGKILGVQVKTTKEGRYSNETDAGFEYLLDQVDLDYWRNSNVPVIIVLVHLDRNEMYWKRVDLGEAPNGRRLKINRAEDIFDRSAVDALASASVKKSTFGVYFPPMRSAENAHMNVIPITLPENVFVAAAEYKSGWKALQALLVEDENPPDDWVIRNGIFWSFNDPRETSVQSVVDIGSLEIIETETISLNDDKNDEYTFIDLLRRTMIQQFENTLNYNHRRSALYFQPTSNAIGKKYHYHSIKQKTQADVVKVYQNKEKSKVMYVRHHAFEPRFWRLGDDWYLSVTPTFVFTWDGYKPDKFEAGRLAGKKKLENNAAILGQFAMWRYFLTTESNQNANNNLFADKSSNNKSTLQFGSLDPVILPRGVPENQWAKDEPPHKKTAQQELPI